MRQIIDQLLNGAEKTSHKHIVKWMWRLVFGGVLFVLLLFIILSFTDLPSIEDLENPKSNEASQVLAYDGNVLGKFYTENRVRAGYDELSPYLVQALIATEDKRYYQHCGIDFRGLGRAVIFMGKKGGASTITQQLARLLFTGKRSKNTPEAIVQKLKEWIIATRLERKYTKEEIIALYLNKYDFINGAQGIRAAAEVYFSKSPKDLNLTEAATLIGMLKNSALFNPLRRPDTVLHRRMVVLKQMEKMGYIKREQYDTLREKPLGLHFARQTHVDGLAPFFRMELGKEVKEILDRPENRKPDGQPYDIYRDGLRIYTTIDPVLQQLAEEEMVKHMKQLQKTFFKHWNKRDPWTYKAGTETEIPLENRKESLERIMRESDRYQTLRIQYLDEITKKLSNDYDLTFHADDREVERIVRESEEEGRIADLVRRKLIPTELAAKYRKVLRSSAFPELKASWKSLQKAVDKEFNTPVPMRVFTYENTKMEKDTVMSPFDSIRYHRMFLQTGIMGVDPKTGFVKVWIGGVNHKYFQFDHVTTNRQVGSTFKPIVYATAIYHQGMSPCNEVYDVPVTIAPGDGNFNLAQAWTPRNSSNKYSGNSLTLREALTKSVNSVSAYLMKQLASPDPVIDLAYQMGINKGRLPRQPSIALGAADLTVTEMTGAFSTFANNGQFNKPIYLLRIEDKNGHEIYKSHSSPRPALSPQSNYVMVEMLRYAGNVGGALKSDVAGKTGTTNDYADGWFIGITPNLVVGTWVGGDDRWVAFRSIDMGQGAYMAKPFFRNFIKRLETDATEIYDPAVRFFRPPGDLGIELDCGKFRKNLIPLEGEGDFEDEFDADPFEEDSSIN